VLVAEGAVDAAVDAGLALWDYAALEPIVTEAGGRCGFAAGRWVSSNAELFDAVSVLVGE
jgi:fructose-1,6-bisphosphatase/inositol monophosphatase family enzyme